MKTKTFLPKMLVMCSLMLLAFSFTNRQPVHANDGGHSQSNVLPSTNVARSAKAIHAEQMSAATDETLGTDGWSISDGGVMGNEGWYVSDVNVLSYKPVSTKPVSTISSASDIAVTKLTDDGVHRVPVYDYLGDKAIRVIQIDKTGPEITWIDMQNGQTASGKMFNIFGETIDEVSFNEEVDISYDDGKTWIVLPLPDIPGKNHAPDDGWTFLWDTTKVPNGNYTVLARSRDVAGNWSKTISLTLIVEN